MHGSIYNKNVFLSLHLTAHICLSWKFECWTLHVNCSARWFRSCHDYKEHCPLPFCITFNSFQSCKGHKVSRVKAVGFIFLHRSWLIKIRFDIDWEQSSLKCLVPLWLVYIIKGNNWCFIFFRKKNVVMVWFQRLWVSFYWAYYDDSHLWNSTNRHQF